MVALEGRCGWMAEVRLGLVAEVKFRLDDRRFGEAEWVKLQAGP